MCGRARESVSAWTSCATPLQCSEQILLGSNRFKIAFSKLNPRTLHKIYDKDNNSNEFTLEKVLIVSK